MTHNRKKTLHTLGTERHRRFSAHCLAPIARVFEYSSTGVDEKVRLCKSISDFRGSRRTDELQRTRESTSRFLSIGKLSACKMYLRIRCRCSYVVMNSSQERHGAELRDYQRKLLQSQPRPKFSRELLDLRRIQVSYWFCHALPRDYRDS